MSGLNVFVTIAVCTRNRPAELRACLESLIGQKTDFTFEILCVENDAEPKMEEIAAELRETAEKRGIPLRYLVQPVQNIGLTRNFCVANSESPFVAFIDDDEYAAEDWLQQLVNVQKQTDADIVTGMVYYEFPDEFPQSVRHSNVYALYTQKNEPEIHPQGGADANATLYRRELFTLREPAFDPEYGRTGGGDYEFALFLLCRGKKIFKTTLARVFEIQPMKRARWNWHLERQFREPSNTLRAIRKHCGRVPAFRFILRRLGCGIRGVLGNLPRLFFQPGTALLNILGAFCAMAGILAAALGFKKRGYF